MISMMRASAGKTMRSQQPLDGAHQVKVKQIRRREVHRDGQRDALVAPATGSASRARLIVRLATLRISPARSAAGRNSSGSSNPRLGWCQRSSASTLCTLPSRRVDLGLVMQRQLVAVDKRGAQFLDEVGVVVAVHLKRRIVDRDLAVGRFGVRDRRLGASQQLLRMVTVVGTERDGDAGIDLQGDRIQRERLAQGFEQTTRLGACGDEVGSFGQQDREFVIAHARQQVLATHAFGEPIRDVAQQLVAEVATDRVVDLPKFIKIQQQQRAA